MAAKCVSGAAESETVPVMGKERHDIYSVGVQSQLNKYYDYAIKKSEGRDVRCFIFSPDYNHIDLSKYASGDKYTVILYSKIYSFYKLHAGEMIH